MRRTRTSKVVALALSALVFSGISLADVSDVYSASPTTYLPRGKTKVQNVRPRPEQHGVNLDGSMRATPGIPAALAGSPFENVWRGTSALEGLRLDTGTYSPTEVDIALPAPGFFCVVGRSQNARQDENGQFDSDGYRHKNQFQSSQPELHHYNPNNNATDVLYLVYGADRYIEFQRAGSSSEAYKSKNGAAGGFTKASGSPGITTYAGTNGTTIKFFGSNPASKKADWQLWKITDADENVVAEGDSTTASTAVTKGFDSGGSISMAADSATVSKWAGRLRLRQSIHQCEALNARYQSSMKAFHVVATRHSMWNARHDPNQRRNLERLVVVQWSVVDMRNVQAIEGDCYEADVS